MQTCDPIFQAFRTWVAGSSIFLETNQLGELFSCTWNPSKTKSIHCFDLFPTAGAGGEHTTISDFMVSANAVRYTVVEVVETGSGANSAAGPR
jgi:hypothetical protein